MKKENIYKVLYVVSALFVLGFLISFGVDAVKYYTNVYIGSAPLYAYLIGRAVEFLLPSVIIFVLGLILKAKYSQNRNEK